MVSLHAWQRGLGFVLKQIFKGTSVRLLEITVIVMSYCMHIMC